MKLINLRNYSEQTFAFLKIFEHFAIKVNPSSNESARASNAEKQTLKRIFSSKQTNR